MTAQGPQESKEISVEARASGHTVELVEQQDQTVTGPLQILNHGHQPVVVCRIGRDRVPQLFPKVATYGQDEALRRQSALLLEVQQQKDGLVRVFQITPCDRFV